MGRQPAAVTVSDALGRAERNLQQGQQDHISRVAEELAGLPPELLAVAKSRQRMMLDSYRPAKYRPQGATVAEPTPERAQKAPDGVDRIDLISGQVIEKGSPASKYPSPTRAQIRPPMTMMVQTMGELNEAMRDGRIAVPRCLCILDKSMNQTQRAALEDFILDVDVIESNEIRISSYGERSSPRASRARISLACNRVKFAFEATPAAFHNDMLDFISHMLNIPRENLRTINEIGEAYTGSTDARVQKGGYMGRMSGIADVLNEIYLAYDIVQRRKKNSLGAANSHSYRTQAMRFFNEMHLLTDER